MKRNYKNILIIRFSSLGDVLLTTPVAESLKWVFPEAKLYFLTKEKYAPLFKNNRNIDKLFLLKGEGISDFMTLLKIIKKNDIDLIIDLHRSLRSTILRYFFMGTDSYNVDKKSIERRMLVWFKKNLLPQNYHVTRAYIETIKPLMSINGILKPKIFLDDGEMDWADKFLKEEAGTDSIVSFSPGARWNTKRWPEEEFASLGNLIHMYSDYSVVLLGDSQDQPVTGKISGFMKRRPVDMAGRLSIREAAAVVKKSRLLVTNDSGLMHVAVSVGTPVIAFFGPTVKDFGFYPLGEKDAIFEIALKCRPCSLHGDNICPKGHHRCMKDINAPAVLEKVLKFL